MPSPVLAFAPTVHSVVIGGALVLHSHLLVVLESAAAQDHAPPARPDQFGLNAFRRIGVAHVDPAHHTVLDIEVGQRGVQPHRHTGLAQPDAQRRDQRAAHADEVLARDLAPPRRAHTDLEAAQHSARVALELVEPDVVLLHHHHVHRHLAVRRLQAGQIGAQLLCVERFGLHGTAGRLAARGLRVVVRVARHPAQLQRRVLEHERQHLRATLQIGVDLLGRHHVADDRVQICAGGLGRVLDPPVALEHLVVRDPHAAT